MVYRGSFSQYHTFKSCEKQWYNNKILKIDIPQDMCYANAGNAVHHTLEQYYSKNIIDINKLKEYFKHQWLELKLDKSKLNMREDEYWVMCLAGIECNLTVTSCEFNMWWPDFNCRLDILDTTNDEIHDWKTSTISEDNMIEYKEQLLLYAAFFKRKFGKTPKKLSVKYLKYTGSKRDYNIEVNEDEIINIFKDYCNVIQQMEDIQNRVREPVKCKQCGVWCPYKQLCENENKLFFKIVIYGAVLKLEGVISKKLNFGIQRKFSYELKDAFFIKQKHPYINTTVRFFNEKTRCLPTPMLSSLKKTLTDYAAHTKQDITIDIQDQRIFSDEQIKMPEKLNNIELRDYQKECVQVLRDKKVGCWQIGTGGGKTIAFTESIRQLNCKTLIIVNRLELLKQTKLVIEKALGVEVGIIGRGEDDVTKFITIATVQTLSKNIKKYQEYINSIRFLIIDECHGINSRSYYKLSKYMNNTEYRLGCCLHRQTNILDNKGHLKNIMLVKIGDKILSYNCKTNHVEEDIVKNIFRKDVEEVYKIKIKTHSGLREIKCSKDHKFYVNGKYISAKDLHVGEELNYIYNAAGKLDNVSKKLEVREKISKSKIGKKLGYIPKGAWKKGHKTWNKGKTKNNYPQIASHRKNILMVEEYGIEKAKKIKEKNKISHLGIKKTNEAIEKFKKTVKERNSLSGEKNGMYTTGIAYMEHKLKNKYNNCQICNINFSLIICKKNKHIHHKDKDRTNNNENNLLVVCPKCHMKLHSKLGDRKGNLPESIKNLRLHINYCEICNIYQKKLRVKFIDNNKKNINRENLKFLCNICHLRVNNHTIKLGEYK